MNAVEIEEAISALAELRAELEEAGNNPRKPLNLRNRIAKVKVFDTACGSRNVLVVAHKEMRSLDQEIHKRQGSRCVAPIVP